MTTVKPYLPSAGIAVLDDIIGSTEVAELLGVTRKHVPMLALRRGTNGFPAPLKRLASGPLYSRSEVRAWQATRAAQRTAKELLR